MNKIDELIQQYCPEGVEYVSIGSLITRVRDKGKNNPSVKTVYSVSNTLGLVKAEDFRDNVIYSEDTSNYVVVEQGMFAYNPARLNIGSLAYLQNNQPGLVSPMYVVLGIDKTKILPKYLYLYLKSPYIICKINSLTESGARFRFDFERWGLIEIPLPPLPVQEAIVNILDCFAVYTAELQAELQARQQQYNYYRDTLLSFEGREDVQWKKLGDVCLKTDNIKWKSTTKTYQYIDLTSVDIQTHSIISTVEIDRTSAPSRAQQIVQKDDVIFATTRPTQMRVCLVPFDYNGQICSTGYCVLRPDTQIVLPKYLFFALAVEDFKMYLSNHLTRGNYPSISNNTLKEYKLPIPPLTEQQRIVDILDRFDTLVNDLSQGLPAEIEARQQQYEYYRDQLLTFKRKEA